MCFYQRRGVCQVLIHCDFFFHQRTPLHRAAIYGHNDVVVYLVGRGAEINTKDLFQVCRLKQRLEGHGGLV